MNEKIRFLIRYFYDDNVSWKTVLIFIQDILIIDDLKNKEQRKAWFKIGKNVMKNIVINYE